MRSGATNTRSAALAAASSSSASSSAPAAAAAAADAADAADAASPWSSPDPEAYHPVQALPPSTTTPSAAFTALAAMPPLRVANLRRERAMDLGRTSNREAFLGQCVGVASATPCGHCARSLGPWDSCVVVAGQFGGSCANCHFNNEGRRCSLRPGKLFLF